VHVCTTTTIYRLQTLITELGYGELNFNLNAM